jgi:aspartyl-tRNA(Asn)/glutamyl-tRNA(Gln) amidotransferase subunit A
VADVLEATVADYYEKVFESYELREQARRFFERYDLLLPPTLPVSAFGAGVNVPPEQPYRNVVSWVCYTYPFHLTGDPAASTPCGFTADGLPVGLRTVAATNREADLLLLGAAFESARPWAHRYPEPRI